MPLPWMLFPVFALIWVAVFALFSVYDGRRQLSSIDELASLILGSLLAAMALAGTLYISFREVSRLLFVTFVILTFLTMLLWRGIARMVLRSGYGQLKQVRKVLILGAGEIGRELYLQIQANPRLMLSVIGFLDDREEGNDLQTLRLGPLASTLNVVQEHKPDDVVIALPQPDDELTKQIIVRSSPPTVKVWLIPDYYRLALHKAAVEEFAGIPMLDLRAPALTDQQRLYQTRLRPAGHYPLPAICLGL